MGKVDEERLTALIEARRWAEAEELLRKAEQEFPFDTSILAQLGTVLWHSGQHRKALESLERALMFDQDDAEVIEAILKVYLAMGRRQDAEDIFRAYMERNPWNYETHEVLRRLLSQGQELVMKQTYSGPSDRPPNEGNGMESAVLLRIGEEEFERQNFDRARVCFQLACEKDPSNARAHNNLGVLAWQEGDLDSALAFFDRALDLDPLDGDVLLNSARALAAAGHGETASQMLEIYLTAHPDEKVVWAEYRDMVRKSAQAWRPDNLDSIVADIYAEMGCRLAEAGDVQGAAEAFARTLMIQPDNVEAYLQLALLHCSLNQFEDAVEVLEQAQSLDGANEAVAKALSKVRTQLKCESNDERQTGTPFAGDQGCISGCAS